MFCKMGSESDVGLPRPVSKSDLMSTSSSDGDLLMREDQNGDLPFDMELSGLNINESPTAPWKAQDAVSWARKQGL